MRIGPHPFRFLCAAAVLAALAAVPLAGSFVRDAHAVDDDAGVTFLNPFPDGDIYQVTVIGDTFADGILLGLTESMGADTRLNIQRKLRPVYAIMSGDFESKAKAFEASIATEPMNIAIVMMGEDDRVSFRNAEGAVFRSRHRNGSRNIRAGSTG